MENCVILVLSGKEKKQFQQNQRESLNNFGYANENLNMFTNSNSNNSHSRKNIKAKENKKDSKETQAQTEAQTYYVLQKLDRNQYTRIIRGSFHQADERFVELSRGKQSAAVSVVALSFFQFNNNPKNWTTNDINNIVINGDIQHHASYAKMKREGKTPQAKYLLTSEVYPYIRIGRQYYYFDGINSISDNFAVEKDVLSLGNLEISLNRFFNENHNQSGVFTYHIRTFAIMQKSNSFFLLNSHPTSYDAEPTNSNDKESSACLMEVFTITCLANRLLAACNQGILESASSICFSLMSLNIKKKVFGEEVLQRKKVNRDLCVVEVNRGGIKRKQKLRHLEGEGKEILEEHTVAKKARLMQNEILTTFDKANGISDKNNSSRTVLIGCGMLNIGNSCFFNACLQAFFHIPIINLHLQNMKKSHCTCFVCTIVTVFKDTHTQVLFDPSDLYQSFQSGNEDLLNGDQQDAHEFWMRLMEAMQNKENCCNTFNELFEHDVVTTVRCGYCHTNFSEKRKFIGHILEIRGRNTIHEAVDSYFGEETVENFLCNTCKSINNDKAMKKNLLENPPNILCLVLNRFDNEGKKIKDNFGLSGKLKLSMTNETQVNYKLVSVINHIGTELYEGHYTAIACSNNSFFEFDDSHVHSINAIIGCNAYILMYELSIENEIDHELRRPRTTLQNHMEKTENSQNNEDTTTNESISSNLMKESKYNHDIMNPYLEEKNTVKFGGRRIVEIDPFFEQIQNYKHSGDCNFTNMKPVKEIKRGLRSIFEFRCDACGLLQMVESCAKSDDSMSINEAAVLGITSTGHGFYHLEEFCAHADIPCMSSKTFDAENKKLQSTWWQIAQKQAEDALNEEIRLAKSLNEVDSKGNALITVVCDGSWGKRSYGKGFNSLSGCAVIVGMRTKKIVYFGVKNKYCHKCKISYSKTCPPNEHDCNINYIGPSSCMEAQIIVEGFRSCERLGARFHQLVADGDSATFKELKEIGIYRNPDLMVQKFECVNHLFRNFNTHFSNLNKNTKYKPGPRKHITATKGNDICVGIRMAAKHWIDADVDIVEKLNNLERDCMNAPYHYFGCHDNCQEYFCSKTSTPESIQVINLLKEHGLFYAILSLCQNYFASNVKSLLANYNNNAAEEFNNLVAKNLGGKRINYSLAGSYTARIATSVVQYNTEGHAGSEFHKFLYEISNNSCLKLENVRKKKIKRNEIACQTKPRTRRIVNETLQSKTGYGGNCDPDMEPRALELAKELEMAKLDAYKANREAIQLETIGQRHCLKWLEVRNKLINSSYFARIINAKKPKSYPNILEEMLYKHNEFAKTADLRHQRLYENDALNFFNLAKRKHIMELCGVFIDKEFSFLSASPLRLYGPNGIVVVKCPRKPFKKTVEEAINSKGANSLKFWKKKNGKMSVNENHEWYIEIQGKLHITERKYAYLVVWLQSEFKIERIKLDNDFWENKMKNKLLHFFNEGMIKELADSRKARKMELRKFDPQQNTFI